MDAPRCLVGVDQGAAPAAKPKRLDRTDRDMRAAANALLTWRRSRRPLGHGAGDDVELDARAQRLIHDAVALGELEQLLLLLWRRIRVERHDQAYLLEPDGRVLRH